MRDELYEVIHLLAMWERCTNECREKINDIIDKLALKEEKHGTDK